MVDRFIVKIQVAILDIDTCYLYRFFNCVNNNFSDKIEIHAFSSLELLYDFLRDNKIEVLLVSYNLLQDLRLSDDKIIVMPLIDNKLICEKNTIFKYQRISQIYKEILNVYSTKYQANISKINKSISTRLLTFMSCDSGTGASTLSIALSKFLAANGKKVLFIDLQAVPTLSCVFEEGRFNMSDIIFALKSDKIDINARIISALKNDSCGVDYIFPCSNIIERSELTKENLELFINIVSNNFYYDYVVIDYDFTICQMTEYLLYSSSEVILPAISNEVCFTKLTYMLQAIEIIQNKNNYHYIDKISLIYNKYNNSNNEFMLKEYKILGYIPKYSPTSVKALSDIISEGGVFDMNSFDKGCVEIA